MNENCGFISICFLAGLGSFFNIFELQFILARIFAAAIALSPFVAFSRRIVSSWGYFDLALFAFSRINHQEKDHTNSKLSTSMTTKTIWHMWSILLNSLCQDQLHWKQSQNCRARKSSPTLQLQVLEPLRHKFVGGSCKMILVLGNGNTSQIFVLRDTV